MSYFNVSKQASEFASELCKLIEFQFVRTVEELLGRVPTDAEVAAFGLQVLASDDPSLAEFYWKDTFLFGVKTTVKPMQAACYFDGPLIKRENCG